ncbi:MAG: DUF4360 domain-containing protein [Bauldia sp.]
MKSAAVLVVAGAAFGSLASGAAAQENQNGCPEGTYSLALTEEGGTLTILFNNFVVELPDGQALARMTCRVHAPLNLPPDTSIGVYRVDYRGYAHLERQQNMELDVVYGFNDGRDHAFGRQIRGAADEDYTFTQNIGAGLMRRVGCGETAALDVEATITLNANRQPGVALATLDTYDGAPRGGLVYHFEFSRCAGGGGGTPR